jgi:peptide-N4-(N-acetyl-beta-glucosaminyl)asparagine amidase
VVQADHVWVEVGVARAGSGRGTSWVHLDPCEAAVDEPLLYQGWGKNQTYIVALSFEGGAQDVTRSYTSDLAAALSRREDSPTSIVRALRQASLHLRCSSAPPIRRGSWLLAALRRFFLKVYYRITIR